MKVYIRTLWNDTEKLWDTEYQRDELRRYLNDLGFYVLTGAGDALDVYVIDAADPIDIRIAKKTLEKIHDLWYTQLRRK